MIARAGLPLWPLPLACALVPVLAVHLAWALSLGEGHIPSCVPYLDGCTSISRAARHGMGNHVFRLLMLPCALLQTLHWASAYAWLRRRHPDPHAGRSLLVLGLAAGFALGVYATFLGTEGAIYGWLRRYGIVFYFAASYLAQLVFLRRYRQLDTGNDRLGQALLAICVLMLVLGLTSTGVSGLVSDPELKDRLENLMEWYLGVLLSVWFALQALLWRRSGFRLTLDVDASKGP